ncbi:MAG: signal peptidase I [Flavobacteriales bacterium]
MEWIPWILLGLLLIEHCIFLPNLFRRAEVPHWHGYVPIFNLYSWLKVIGRPWYWIFLMIIPGINLWMLVIMHVELGIVFGQRSTAEQWQHGALPWIALPRLSKSNAEHVGPRDWSKTKKSTNREWGESILWALIVATIVRTFMFEAFMIPTGSMEGSMLVGDYLYVSKTAYGPKTPQTPVSIPLIHNAIPGGMKPSYTEWFSLPYFRIPGFGEVQRYDAVVFNFPHGDTIIVDSFLAGHDYYERLRSKAIEFAKNDVAVYASDPAPYENMARRSLEKQYGLRARPLDKSENYVKRCVGLPGETISASEGLISINNKELTPPEGVQFNYKINFASPEDLKRAQKVLELTNIDKLASNGGLECIWALTAEEKAQLEESELVQSIERIDLSYHRGRMSLFPNAYHPEFNEWDADNFGPITIPNRGMTVELNERNLLMYERAITQYEGHDLTLNDGEIHIDGKPASEYTFELDYYWMMGDNRHNSADSRFWGFVPETHIVGKASFVWFSKQNKAQHGESKIRWNRMFRSVK